MNLWEFFQAISERAAMTRTEAKIITDRDTATILRDATLKDMGMWLSDLPHHGRHPVPGCLFEMCGVKVMIAPPSTVDQEEHEALLAEVLAPVPDHVNAATEHARRNTMLLVAILTELRKQRR